MVPCLRSSVTWFTLLCFLTTQSAALAQAHDEGTAAGHAANLTARSLITAPKASEVVPGYTTAPPELAYYGQSRLSAPANARLAACAFTPNDPVCQAQRGAVSSASTPRNPVSPYDPAVQTARAIAANPGTSLEDLASYYSGCQVNPIATPSVETRVCRQYSGLAAQPSCARTLTVSVARSTSCTPGEWFAHAGLGGIGLDVQCVPDRPAGQQHFRTSLDGVEQSIFDINMSSPLVFPQEIVVPPDGLDGLWIVDNQCMGDGCQLTALLASPQRSVCTGSGKPEDTSCTQERPFLEIYGPCPHGTQSGNNILTSSGSGEEHITTYLDQAICYVPSIDPTPWVGHDVTGDPKDSFWAVHSPRPIVGWRMNPTYGLIPLTTLSYERPHNAVTQSDAWSDACSATVSNGCSAAAEARCVEGPATKEVDGYPVTRACWRYETHLSCATADATNECAPLVAAGCAPSGSACRQVNSTTGLCEVTEKSYSCPVAPGSNVTASNCPANVFCLAGSCFSTNGSSDTDFARSMSFMEAAREAGVYLETDHMQVFRGEANSCRDRLFTNCCNSDAAGAGMSNRSLFGSGSGLVYDSLMNSGNREFLMQGM